MQFLWMKKRHTSTNSSFTSNNKSTAVLVDKKSFAVCLRQTFLFHGFRCGTHILYPDSVCFSMHFSELPTQQELSSTCNCVKREAIQRHTHHEKCFQCLPSSTSRFKANLAEHVVRSWTFTLAEHVVHGGGRPHFVVHLIVQHRGTAVLATSCAMDCLPAKKTDAQIVSKRQC